MADDQASQRRSRPAPPPPPPPALNASSFRTQPAASTSRFGFGSSTSRSSTFGSSTTAPRASTLSTSRTASSTFSSAAFGRSTLSTSTTSKSTLQPRPSSAEASSTLSSSRLRQKPVTAAAAAATSTPATSELFATLASDGPPRSSSGGSSFLASYSASTGPPRSSSGGSAFLTSHTSSDGAPRSASGGSAFLASYTTSDGPPRSSSGGSTFLTSYTTSDGPPRSISGGSTFLTSSMAIDRPRSTSSGSVAYSASDVASKPAGQLFSMDDTDLGGDDGWGVDSPSNILSPASATGETTAATGASKPFEDEDDFDWNDDAPVTTTTTTASTTVVEHHRKTELSAVPTPPPMRAAAPSVPTHTTPAPPATTSSSGWGDDFEYTDDATEATADASAWQDEDEWGTTTANVLEVNAAKATTSTSVMAASSVAKTTAPTSAPVAVPPLSSASAADLGAVLSPTSAPAGEFWGDEGDDVLFSDDEQSPDAAPEETLPAVGAMSLATEFEETVTEETKTVEIHAAVASQQAEVAAVPPQPQPVANDFSFQEPGANNSVAEAVQDWEDEGDDWGEELRLSEDTAEISSGATAHTECATELITQVPSQEEAATSEVAAPPPVSLNQTIEAESHHAPAFSLSSDAAPPVVDELVLDAAPSVGLYEEHTKHSHTESHTVTEQTADYFSYGESSSFSYPNQTENVEATQQSRHHEVHGHYATENGAYGEDLHESHGHHETASVTFSEFDVHHESAGAYHAEATSESIHRQVSWEAREEDAEVSTTKAIAVAEDSPGTASFAPPSVSTSKGEVSFGTSSFAAAELTYGHYHHDTHRTPSEAEAAGSVASFAEASSAGATFGGSDHVSDGTYSDGGDYASETRSVFGTSSQHSTAFITEPASSSDGQASTTEDNGTYENHSDMSSTVGGGGGASEFDVSSTRSALFENEVASAGFEHGEESYEYGDHHGHHSQNHFGGGGSYDDHEYSHHIPEESTNFTKEESHAQSFGHTDESMITSTNLGRLPDAQPSPSSLYSRSSSPATYGVSSSQDLPTASDLEFDHSDTENLFASSSSDQEMPFGKTYHQTQPAPTGFAVAEAAADASTAFESGAAGDDGDANPFASSGSSFFPPVPAPTSFQPSPAETQAFETSNASGDALPSADSLFGPTPPKGAPTPFGSFGPPSSQPEPQMYDEPPIADAGGLFADAPATSGFGGFEQPTSAPASSFFGESHAESDSYGYNDSVAPSHYNYEAATYPSATEEAFSSGNANHSHAFETHAYGQESSYQSAGDTFGDHAQHSAGDAFGSHPEQQTGFEASEAFAGHTQSTGIEGGDYGYDAQSHHHSAAEAFGAPMASAFPGQGDAGFDGYGSSTGGDAVSADSFFGGSSASTSAADMFGSGGGVSAHHDQHHDVTQYHGEGRNGEETWQSGSDNYGYPASSAHDSYAASATEESAPPAHDYGHPPTEYSTEIASADVPDASSFDLPSESEYAQDWSYGETTTESHSFDHQQSSAGVGSEETSDACVQEPTASSSFDHGYAAFEGAGGDTDTSFGKNASVPPTDFDKVSPQDGSIPHGSPSAAPTSPTDVGNAFKSGASLSLETQKEALPSGNYTDMTESSTPFDNGAESSTHPFESAGPSEFATTPFADQTVHDGAGDLDFGGESTLAANPFEQGTDSSQYQTDSAAFFGGQESDNVFGAPPGHDQNASGFYSNGPSQYHHSGGIYAQPPQESAAYHGYDATSYQSHQQHETSYTHYQDSQGGYNAPAVDYSQQDAHYNQSDAFQAHATPSHDGSVDYGVAPPHGVKSPTTAAAQSASAFQYNQSTETSGGGQQHLHHDASYRSPTLYPGASLPAATLDPAPQHASSAAKPNYNRFAAPTQAPAYGAGYETKVTSHGEVAGAGARVLTSNKYKDPNIVVPSCLSSFGFGGNVVTMFPKQKLRLNSASFAARNSPRTPQSMQFDGAPQGELRKGPVGVYRMDHVHPQNGELEELDKFPGPLSDNVTEEAILHYVDEKMNAVVESRTLLEEDERLLLGVLKVLIRCNGRLRSDANANPNEPTSPEVQLVSLLKESDQRRRRNHSSQFPPPKPVQPSHPDATLRNASRVRELLLLGDRKAAVDVAIQAHMWPEAMLIGSFTDKDEYKRVLCAYFTSHYAPGDPCRALYLSFADQQEKSVHEPQKLMQQSKDDDGSAILSSWVVHVQMLLANRTADTNKILVELGDRLWKETHGVVAAHVCYLLAGNTVEAPSPSSKIALLGADHRSPEEARFYVSPGAVQRTEIYEWIQKKINPAATNLIPFQGYKLIYAMILADHGKLETAFKYVNSMLTVIRAITATMKPGTSMYLEGMQNQLVVLDDRLRQHLGQDRADSVAAAASAKQGKWGLGSALSIMGKIVNRVVEGSDAPQPTGPPRSANGSLFPGAPRSNNSTNAVPGQPEYPSGAVLGYSSQAAPTMVPSGAPGSGRSGGIYAQPAAYNQAAPPQAYPPAPAPAAPSVPAAFIVPRQVSSGRNGPQQPPSMHQPPMQDYAAPTSGNGSHGYGAAPLSGSSGYDARPPQQQMPPSLPSNSYLSGPPSGGAPPPPPFQKPTLDLSGSAGNSGYGAASEPAAPPPPAPPADKPKPKSPPRSPRSKRIDNAPGSDKGSASPKAKDVAPKKGGRSKTPPPSRSSSGWLSGISTFIAAKMNPDAKVAKLGDHMDAYFDEEKKRWVFPGETQTDEPVMPSAPPTGPMPGSTPGSSSGGPPGGPPGAHSAPGSMAGGASAADDPLAALMAPPPARALMKKDPLAAMMAPPPNRAFGPRSNTMQAKRPPPRPQFAVFKPAPGSTASSAPSDQGPPSTSGDAPPPPPQ